jgi:predicted tellurium resistance membrane protein TerC
MSLDNVLAVAAAAKGSLPLLIFGLVLRVRMIPCGSALTAKFMNRYAGW